MFTSLSLRNDLFFAHDITRSLESMYLAFQNAFHKVTDKSWCSRSNSSGFATGLKTGTASVWASITSWMLQGSVLWPILFMIYINDIDIRLINFIAKFTDDMKTANVIITDCNRMSLQEDLRKISEWPERWEMPFHVNKYHISHVGTKNLSMRWTVVNSTVYNVSEILALRLWQASNFPSSAKMPQVKLIECQFL